MSAPSLEIKNDTLILSKYPFVPASVYPEGRVEVADIDGIFLERSQPEVLLKSGEVLFFNSFDRYRLYEFALRTNLPLYTAEDAWSFLLRPYLDMPFSDEDASFTLKALKEIGFSEEEVIQIRKRVAPSISRANAWWWLWDTMGHYDLLSAYHRGFSRLFKKRLHAMYHESMKIAGKAPRKTIHPKTIEDTVKALHYDELYALWKETVRIASLDENKALQLYHQLLQAYASSERGYHNTVHLQSVLTHLMSKKDLWEDGASLLLAAWWHDFHMKPPKEAEERSALALKIMLHDHVSKETIVKATELIRLTKIHHTASTQDEKLLVDADLYVLGDRALSYDHYARGVRYEYQHIPWILYVRGRKKVLQHFLKLQKDRGHLGHFLNEAWEKQAEENLSKEISYLTRHWLKEPFQVGIHYSDLNNSEVLK